MKREIYCAALAACAASGNALAVGSLAQVEIVDRDSGAALSPHYYHGEYWVAGRPGARYAIRIKNRADGRILAVTSVDGVNVLSGETAAFAQQGYVFDLGQQYEITGWRKSRAEVAAFTFTDATRSYAELTGRPANVGVIGVALFQERWTAPPAISSAPAPAPTAGARAPAAPSAGSNTAQSILRGLLGNRADGGAAAAPKLGTGHGERENSPVELVNFERRQSEPNELVRIRYDSLENLIARGVIRRPAADATRPEPFPAEGVGFVPDPPG
jgi:hypothetical protein